jgi:hypothetical protein
MSKGLVERSSLEVIANAIREKNGLSDIYKPVEMGPAILALEGGREDHEWHQCPEAVRNYIANVNYTDVAYT